ncbi:beta-galactosidase [Fervidibacter sacchari]|uniref:Glycoside hydrolase family 42 N-terminal domain-containing protein n=1 Tax=Candidatus Fervidibacter sacchari TaxID=1448929 RepID=A0ABT2EMQ0_9BACT|nr:beta-galactosidase [Candidatus Fervidibacter sacchari]MCS3919234.1 hypothetical protein [Candidatus Fervidibacter sacchari]WKU17036.1 beta-galactosidase [Candidatus Fervidibacter sacchari]
MKRRQWLKMVSGVMAMGIANAKVEDSTKPRVRFISWGGIGHPKRVRAAAQIGVDTHRLPINPWPDEQGRYDFRLAEIYLTALKEAGITTVIHIFSHGVPEWFWQKYPDAMPLNESGETDNSYGSVWHPKVRAQVRKGIVALLDYLGERDLLRLVDGIEVGVAFEGQLSYKWHHFWAFDPHALKAYRFFLRGRYSEINRLNNTWGTRYRSFTEIKPPIRWSESPQCYDFLDFYRQSLLDAAEEWSEAVVAKFSPKFWLWLSHFIAPNQRPYAARYPAFYLRHLKKLNRADVAIVSVVPGWQTKEEIAELKELGITVIGEWEIVPNAESQRRQARLAWDLGCDGFFVGVLENLADEAGALTEVGKVTAEIISRWQRDQSP